MPEKEVPLIKESRFVGYFLQKIRRLLTYSILAKRSKVMSFSGSPPSKDRNRILPSLRLKATRGEEKPKTEWPWYSLPSWRDSSWRISQEFYSISTRFSCLTTQWLAAPRGSGTVYTVAFSIKGFAFKRPFILWSDLFRSFPVWSRILNSFSLLLMVVNSSMNILFYGVFNGQFRKVARWADSLLHHNLYWKPAFDVSRTKRMTSKTHLKRKIFPQKLFDEQILKGERAPIGGYSRSPRWRRDQGFSRWRPQKGKAIKASQLAVTNLKIKDLS